MTPSAVLQGQFASCLLFFVFSVMRTEEVVTSENITTVMGGAAILRCHLAGTEAKITQFEWRRCDGKPVFVSNVIHGVHIMEEYKGRVSLDGNTTITLQGLTGNDTGEYCCIFTTFPMGRLEGKVFVTVLRAQPQDPLLGSADWLTIYIAVGALCLAILCGIICLIIYQQKRRIRNPVHVAVHSGSLSAIQPSFIGKRPQPSSDPGHTGHGESEDDPSEDYFNILVTRSSKGSQSLPTSSRAPSGT
ncbi:T-cell immunoreceptor with Ig and ITIM domains isoform X2 [Amia ocellicauda]|uniref:T-cell immunoreceptor with Ig and ITIM domains isoform X2 n=1 Tax=Amia ocellicauda TaxID=2972642 RepID=UPI003464BB96